MQKRFLSQTAKQNCDGLSSFEHEIVFILIILAMFFVLNIT